MLALGTDNPDVRFMNAVRPYISPIAFRELLEAAAGWKVARVPISPRAAIAVVPLLRRHGVAVAVSEHRFVHEPDQGKGGWSNRLARVVEDDADVGDVYVYAAQDERLIIVAADAEADGDNNLFGEILAIPACCRAAFARHLELVRAHQNDPIHTTIAGTITAPPHGPWNNIAAQYFGRCLLSYAPCSLDCEASTERARLAHALLEQVDRNEARAFLDAHRCSYVFSDRQGVHRLDTFRIEDGVLRFNGVTSTVDGPLRRRLIAADGLKASSLCSFEMLSRLEVVDAIEDSARLALFWCGDDH